MLRHAGMAHRIAAHMRLVDDRALPRRLRLAFLAPGESRVDHPAFRHVTRAVALVEGEIGVGRTDGVAEQRLVPLEIADELAGIWIDQELVWIEAMAVRRIVRPRHAIAIDGARPRVRQIAVPYFIRVFGQRDPFDLGRAVDVEDAQFHLAGVRGKQREINADSIPSRAQREGLAFADAAADRRARQNQGRRNGRDLDVHGGPKLTWPPCQRGRAAKAPQKLAVLRPVWTPRENGHPLAVWRVNFV